MFAKEHCSHFQMLPIGMRVLFSGTLIVLGTGYLFAMIYIFESHAGRDGDPGLSVDDLIIAYSGSKSDTKLESALKGPMANMLPPEENHKIVAWVRRGAAEADFATTAPTRTSLTSPASRVSARWPRPIPAWISSPWCVCPTFTCSASPLSFLLSVRSSAIHISAHSGSSVSC